jgi:hypothetical protein
MYLKRSSVCNTRVVKPKYFAAIKTIIVERISYESACIAKDKSTKLFGV